MSARPSCLVVIPTYCERDNLEALVREVLASIEADVLVVDDDSPDGTGQLADQLAAATDRVSVLHRRGAPRGLGCAYRDGFARALAAGHEFVVQMDADGSHNPAYLPELLAAAARADLVIGSRYVPGGAAPDWTWTRRLISQGGSTYARWLLGLGVADVTGGFKCWRAEALRAVDPASAAARGFAFQIEMNHRAVRSGLRVIEVPIRFRDRQRGRSKMSPGIFVEGLLAVWRIRGSRWP
jgi:dolichol-phosphate mannosyltransferase